MLSNLGNLLKWLRKTCISVEPDIQLEHTGKDTGMNTKGTGWLNRFFVLLTGAYLVVALVASIPTLILALRWYHNPFIGALVEHTLILNPSAPSQPSEWDLQKLQLDFGYRITALNGENISSVDRLNEMLSQHSVGDQVSVILTSPLGETQVIPVVLKKFALQDFLAYFLIPYLIALIYLGSGAWVFGFRRRDAAGIIYTIFTASAGLVFLLLFDRFTTAKMVIWWSLAVNLTGGSLITLALVFPEEYSILMNRWPLLRWLGLLLALVLFSLTLPTLYNLEEPLAYASRWQMGYLFIGVSVLLFLASTVYRRLRSASPVVREQARMTLISSAFAFSPITIWLLASVIWRSPTFSHFLFLPTTIFTLVIGYNLARYRLLQADYIMRQVVAYSIMMLLAGAAYALLVAGLTLFFGSAVNLNNPYAIGALLFLIAFLFNPLVSRIQQLINNAFARGQTFYRERTQSFIHDLTQVVSLEEITSLLRQYINDTLSPHHLHIFVLNISRNQYEATADETGKPTSDLRFPQSSALPLMLSSQRSAVFLGDMTTLPAALKADKARLGLLGSQLFVPLPGQRMLTGWIALDRRRSGEPFRQQDIAYLEMLCDQAALALERAQVVSDLEQRIRDMNILTQLSQGINITLEFDDILELIYTRTTQAIQVEDYWIALSDPSATAVFFRFYVEKNERLQERENQPIPPGQGLERIVISSQRMILTEDYEHECRIRGLQPITSGIFAWIGLPLNDGANTIGAVCLGSRDPTVLFSEEQIKILQAIADQAAGAVVKARALEQAEMRARQLTTLNEVARSLTSTLDLNLLLNQILNKAVEILNCSAGSLLLVDEQTGELVFEQVVGPVASSLLKTRLPPGTGLVGRAVESRQAVIENDVRRAQDWSSNQDQQTGFTTTDILAVPMISKDRVIGVIEVINRQDKLPFTKDDQDLLTAFTSQASIALENARLYTLTDQSLRDSVEELSVLQRIDRELNASLDVSRAMRITLTWAMQRSKATAGLVGIIEDECIRIMASEGYTTELNPYLESGLPMNIRALKQSIETGQIQILIRKPGTNGSEQVLYQQTAEQLIIPIRRESMVIGIILLESAEVNTVSEETTREFLTRLSDHAAIAIANARLYAEVQAANQAKTDFISLVSHELKTPMTSIKGFTDLLAAQVVGPVNENQANFLATIRSNVDRMATLVSDLADVSRIEAGRLRLEPTAVPVKEIVEEVVRSARAQIEEKRQTLIINVPDDLPPMWGDRTRLIQILTNLVSNAYKYTPNEGTLTINAECTENMWDESSPLVIHISVKDSGYGISPENQKKIFQKFFRSDDEKIREAPGTGLGLNITKQLVELHGGHIWFESVYRVGTTFHFTIPIAENV